MPKKVQNVRAFVYQATRGAGDLAALAVWDGPSTHSSSEVTVTLVDRYTAHVYDNGVLFVSNNRRFSFD